MANRQGSDKEKFLAWVLNKEYGYNVSRIARFMGWGVTTVRSWIIDVDYKKQIFDLTNQLNEARMIANSASID